MAAAVSFLGRRATLGALAAAAFVRASLATPANRLAVGGTGASVATMRRLVAAFARDNPGLDIVLPNSLGSTGGLRAVVAGEIDVATMSRAANEAEAAAGIRSVPYGRSPFVFVTSLREPPADLTSSGVVEILAMRRRAWPDGSPIRIILRPKSDGDTAFLVSRFPGAQEALAAVYARQVVPVAQTDQDNLDLAERLAGSFAGATLAPVISEARNLRVLALDNVLPSIGAMESGAYPHVRSLHLATGPASSEAGRAFVAFVRSSRGAAILEDCGTAPVAR